MNLHLSLALTLGGCVCALGQSSGGGTKPLPTQWLHDGRIVVPEYNFSIDSPSVKSRCMEMPGNHRGTTNFVFLVEDPDGAKYVVMTQEGLGRLNGTDTNAFVAGMQKSLPPDWKVQDASLEASDIPARGAMKVTATLRVPDRPAYYAHGYLVSGRRDYVILTYTTEARESSQFNHFAGSFSLLLPRANTLPPNAPQSPLISIVMIVGLVGVVIDWRYKRRGGRKPTTHERTYFWIAVALCVVLLIFLGVRGASAEGLGRWTGVLLIVILGIWEIGRWRIRRKYPLTGPVSLPKGNPA